MPTKHKKLHRSPLPPVKEPEQEGVYGFYTRKDGNLGWSRNDPNRNTWIVPLIAAVITLALVMVSIGILIGVWSS